MKKFFLLFIGVVLFPSSLFATKDLYFDYYPNNLTVSGINYKLNGLSVDSKRKQIVAKIALINLDKYPQQLDIGYWRLAGQKPKRMRKQRRELTLAANGYLECEVSFPYRYPDHFLLDLNSVSFNVTVWKANSHRLSELVPESTLIFAQPNRKFLIDRIVIGAILFINNDFQDKIAQVFLVVPTKNIMFKQIDFKHFFIDNKDFATHILVKYLDGGSALVSLSDISCYFPEDQIDLVVESESKYTSLVVTAVAELDLIRVSLFMRGKYYLFSEKGEEYRLKLLNQLLDDNQEATLYIKTPRALYHKQVTL